MIKKFKGILKKFRKEENKVIKTARYLRKLRLDRQWKQEYVALKLHISRTLLSEIEQGHSPINEDLKLSLVILYEVKQLESEEQLELNLRNLFLAVYHCDQKTKSLYNELITNESVYINSPLFIDYWLILFIYTATYKLDSRIYYQRLMQYGRFLTIKENQYFSLFKAIQLRNEFRDLKAMDIIQLLLDLEAKDLYFEGLLNYHASYLFYGLGDYINSLRCVYTASYCFKETLCPIRYFRVRSQEANIYMASHLYAQADAINKDLIKETKGKLPAFDYNSIVSNAALTMIYTYNYETAMQYIEMRTTNWEEVPQMYFNIAWTLLKTNRHNEALIFIKDNLNKINNKYIKDMLQIIVFLIKDPTSIDLKRLLKKCEQYLLEMGDYDAIRFIYNLLLEYYQRKSNLKQQLQVMKKLIIRESEVVLSKKK